MVAVCTSREQLRLALPYDRARAVVMTLGALHAGHASLIDAARHAVGPVGHVTVTVFVNPLQFGPSEDLDRYPRTPQADIDLAAAHGCDVVFVPRVGDVFGQVPGSAAADISVDPGPLGGSLEGAARPGHFAGVLTVVLTLLQLTRADLAFFGEKDYQQLTLVRAMCDRLALGVRVVGVPTVRDADGLALSSRNRYLSDHERSQARAIPAALFAAQEAAAAGADSGVIVDLVRGTLADSSLVADYIELTDPDLGPAPAMGEARLLVAVPVGRTRLLDNVGLLLKGAA